MSPTSTKLSSKSISVTYIYMILYITGSVLLDLEEWELNEIFHRVTENLITSDQVSEENRGEVLRALLVKHK